MNFPDIPLLEVMIGIGVVMFLLGTGIGWLVS